MSQTDRFFSPRPLRQLVFRVRRETVSGLSDRIRSANGISQHLSAPRLYVARFGGLSPARGPRTRRTSFSPESTGGSLFGPLAGTDLQARPTATPPPASGRCSRRQFGCRGLFARRGGDNAGSPPAGSLQQSPVSEPIWVVRGYLANRPRLEPRSLTARKSFLKHFTAGMFWPTIGHARLSSSLGSPLPTGP